MANEPITHVILQTARGFYRREIVAGMALALSPTDLKISEDGATYTYPRADAAPAQVPAPVMAPTVPAEPISTARRLITRRVGPNQQFKRYAEAMTGIADEAAKGPMQLDIQLEVPSDPAYYLNDVSSHYRESQGHPLDWPPFEQIVPCDATIRRMPGSTGLVPFPVTAAALYYGKAPFILGPFAPASSGTVTLEGLRITGAKRGDNDGNIAAIRMEGTDGNPRGTITVRDCELADCDDGFLGGSAGQTLLMERVYVHDCGSGSGFTHNLYLGAFDRVELRDVLSVRARVGHLLKCRARTLVARKLRLFDLAGGTASYCFDAPNGGTVDVDGLVTHKGARSSNSPVMAIGEEGDGNGGQTAGGSIRIRNWTALSDRADAVPLWNATGLAADISGTRMFGMRPMMRAGLFGQSSDVAFPDARVAMLGAMPALDLASPVRLQAAAT